jgi:tRNA dimethylallyltransferase
MAACDLPDPMVIAGPTASGKSAVAIALAELTGAEIVNADPFQIWQGLALVSAQPGAADLARVKHHLYGCFPPDFERDAMTFSVIVGNCLAELKAGGRRALVVSGSGLYLRALWGGVEAGLPAADPRLRADLEARPLAELLVELEQVDPDTFSRIDRMNPRRVVRALEIWRLSGRPASDWIRKPDHDKSVKINGIWLQPNADWHKQRILERSDRLFSTQLAEEVAALAGRRLGESAGRTLGLAEARAWVAGELGRDAAVERVARQTWQYARRQRTWFRRAAELVGLPLAAGEDPAAVAARILAGAWLNPTAPAAGCGPPAC